ncbi:GmrSD restriction endonuclease domain-containing protein [Williamsia limnetica]|uniref:GmrSD restriction endonuclease domain-containing protein n=1 Tax=Williamsia limnetica TaxID=882452 RepID=UPI003CCC530A
MSDPFAMPTNCDRPPAPQPPKKRRWPWVAGGLVAVLVALGTIGAVTEDEKPATVADTAPAPPSTTTMTVTAPATTTEKALPVATPVAQVTAAPGANAAMTKLNALAVKGRAPKTGYDRGLFGEAWTDAVSVEGGRNGCDTRNDILRRDLTQIVFKAGSQGCAVQTGVLADPYTGTSIDFLRGQDTSSAVQIDHVVALSDAWQKGAQQLSPAKRIDFANDPRNLQATDGPTNQQKSDGDAATWLPPSKSYRCTYVARQVDVKSAYQLWVTQAEKDAIASVLSSCGATMPETPVIAETETATPIPRTSTPAPVRPANTPPPAPAYTPPPEPVYTPPAVVDAPVSYANCSAVRAAGAAPIYAGQPGYSSKLDRDGDGVACET